MNYLIFSYNIYFFVASVYAGFKARHALSLSSNYCDKFRDDLANKYGEKAKVYRFRLYGNAIALGLGVLSLLLFNIGELLAA